MATELDIANRALSRIGVKTIATTLSTSAPVPDVAAVRAVSNAIVEVRQEVLRAHPWNFATNRDRISYTSKTITGITKAASAVVSSTAHGLTTNTFVRFESVVGMVQINGMVGKITSVNANDFTVDITSTSFSTYTSGGVAIVCPAFGYANLFAQPSDCLRVLEIDGQEDSEWTTEGRNILTDEGSPILIRYIKDEQDETKYDSLFVNAMSARLAAEVAEELTHSTDKRQMAWSEYQGHLAEAKSADAREQTPEYFEDDPWILARY